MKYIKTYEGLFDFFKKKETDPKKIEIIKLCKQYKITKYTINDDYSIDVDGNVDINDNKLEEIPIKFNKVTGYFSCVGNFLTDLENSPRWVGGNFFCQRQYDNSLKSLKGAPDYVEYRFECDNNDNLKSLEGIPEYIGGSLDISYTGVYSFDYIKDSITTINTIGTPLADVIRCFSNSRDFYDKIDIFKAYDPIHPPKNEEDKPILYMDRFRLFLEEVQRSALANVLKVKNSNTYRMLEKTYEIKNL